MSVRNRTNRQDLPQEVSAGLQINVRRMTQRRAGLPVRTGTRIQRQKSTEEGDENIWKKRHF